MAPLEHGRRRSRAIASEKTTCGKKAAFIYTWTANRRGLICREHAEKMQQVAAVLGHYAHMEAIDYEVCRCEQKVCREHANVGS